MGNILQQGKLHKLQPTKLYIYFLLMTAMFPGSSRMANFREKKNSGVGEEVAGTSDLKLTLPEAEEKTSYEPSTTFSNTRTSLRLFKGKIDRGQSSDKTEIKSVNTLQTQPGTTQKLSLPDPKQDLKLVLNDSPQIAEKKPVQQAPSKPTQKRILIAKQPPKEEPAKQVPPPPPQRHEEPVKTRKPEPPREQPKQEYVNPHDQKPIIKEEEVEESKDVPDNENDLVMCPEGCGRKFNRKALEKHAKACKLVFMSKRKQFNSEAKRLTSKEQATLVKQNKLKEKTQLGKTKSKGFQKTSDNWKAASEDFRAAIKAIKKDEDNEGQQQNEQTQEQKQAALNLVPCEFCEKMFAQVLIEKHLDNCIKKKEKEKDKKKVVPAKKK